MIVLYQKTSIQVNLTAVISLIHFCLRVLAISDNQFVILLLFSAGTL
jgi:hypothetical protein